jgi:hypothetical protein
MAGSASPPVDADLMALAWEILAERAERTTRKRRMINVQHVAIAAWCDFVEARGPGGEVEAPEVADAELEAGVATIGVLARRLTALADVLAHIEAGSYPVDVLVDVAAVAPLAGPEERPQFQLLDFLARADRAAAG